MNEQQKNRLDSILAFLDSTDFASIRELSVELGVTEMTVRRDIQILKDSGIVRQLHGAVSKNPDYAESSLSKQNYSIMQTESIKKQEKNRIGKEAVRMIKPGNTIFIDIGTTAAALSRAIPFGSDITAICFSMNIFEELAKKKLSRIYLAGGFYHSDTQAFESDEAVSSIKSIRANIAFIAPSAISMSTGITAMTPYEARIKNSIIENTEKRILIADSSKFSEVNPCFVSFFDKINAVITDRSLSDEWIGFFKDKDIELHLC